MGAPPKTADHFWSDLGHGGRSERDCWPWPKRCDKDGYGGLNRVVDGVRYQRAHRLAYRYAYGPFAQELAVLHRCDNPPCCNPNHLFLGTAADNNADMIAKKRDRYLSGDEHPSRRNPEWVQRGDDHYLRRRPDARAKLVAKLKERAKITDEQVVEMRALYAAGGWTFDQLAERYGISKGHAHAVVRGRFRSAA